MEKESENVTFCKFIKNFSKWTQNYKLKYGVIYI
jgi:hypothetical protein